MSSLIKTADLMYSQNCTSKQLLQESINVSYDVIFALAAACAAFLARINSANSL